MNKKLLIVLILFGVLLIIVGSVFIIMPSPDITEKNKILHQKLTDKEYRENLTMIQNKVAYYDTYLQSKYPIKDLESLSNQEKTLFLLQMFCNYQKKEIAMEQLDKEKKEYFSDFDLHQSDVKDSNNQVAYKYNNSKYTYQTTKEISSCNFYAGDEEHEAYTDEWIIKKKIAYFKAAYENDTYKLTIYKNNIDCQKDQNSISTINSDVLTIPTETYEEIKNQLLTMKYSFKKEEDTYRIKSIVYENGT